MARAGEVIESPDTRLVFLKTAAGTDGELLRFEQFVKPGHAPVPEHVHPHQEEHFAVLSGNMGVRTAGTERVVGAGAEVVVPPGTPHTFWNAGEGELRHVVELGPALRHETFFETVFGLQRDGRSPANPLQGALIVLHYGNYLARPPIHVQKILFGPLGLLGRLLGYRASYSKYSGDRVERNSS
jgi:mannose-6-phosphate isomerase-like protein (cupin superfamily)